MHWRERFRDKLVTAADAVRRVKNGDLVRLPMGPVPVTLVNALARRRDELDGVRVWQGASRHLAPWATGEPGWEDHILFVTDFLSPMLRPVDGDAACRFRGDGLRHRGQSAERGARGQFRRRRLHGAGVGARRERAGQLRLQLWHSKSLLRAAKLSVAEVGDRVMRTCGENFVHLSEFDLLVEHVDPPRAAATAELTPERIEVTEVIGAYVSTLVNDGDTVQIGTGTCPRRWVGT